jgi:hypothetical protein
VGGRTTGYPPALDHALKALALGHADHVDQLALREGRGGDDVTHLQLGFLVEADFGQHAGGGIQPGLLRVAELAGGAVLFLLAGEPELHGVVAIAGGGLDLDHGAGAGLDHGDRHEHILCVVNLGHPEFLT